MQQKCNAFNKEQESYKTCLTENKSTKIIYISELSQLEEYQ